ncbi:hypothetical protein MNBD_GAMMA12-1196 [hydrothermal vent metagenome]|uniref:Uncharacterized protein n=1 Tax=hydrothermal vent metagenome TaxID=652676 RepID=A0A3B0ZC33_9ZZZZ
MRLKVAQKKLDQYSLFAWQFSDEKVIFAI